MSQISQQQVLLSPSTIDQIPHITDGDEATKQKLKAQFQQLWQRYENSTGREQDLAFSDLRRASANVLSLVQTSIRPALDQELERLDDCWQGYVDIGAKYFLNIPTTIWNSDYEDTIFPDDDGNLRYIFETGIASTLVCLATCRVSFQMVEDDLAHGKLADLVRDVQILTDDIDHLEGLMDAIESSYEQVFAAMNALRASGRLPDGDIFEAERMSVFEAWSGIVADFSARLPEEFLRVAREMGWVDEIFADLDD